MTSPDERMRRALVELWQDHQEAWPVGAPERRCLHVEGGRVRDLANLRGGKKIRVETIQNAGRKASREGTADLGHDLHFSYAKGTFTVWEGDR